MSGERERFELDDDRGRIAYEHLHRYSICREYVAGMRVLDLACGTGYGSFILSSGASEVVGVDVDASAIRQASKRYCRPNVRFQIADCFDLPFEAKSFDVVIANEMIEHVEDHDGLIQQAKRVLVDGGLFLVSTPNKPVYNQYKTPNPFHVSEMEIPEFRGLLSSHFGHVRFTGLRMALVSAGFDLEDSNHGANLAAAKLYHGVLSDSAQLEVENEELCLDFPEYILAACSDRPINELSSRSSLFFSRTNDLWLEHEKTMAWASQLHEEDEILRADLQKMRSHAEESRAAQDAAERESAELLNRLTEVRDTAEITTKALTQEREAVSRENSMSLQASSRLLSHMVSAPVEADQVSLVEALFKLNEIIVSQRMQLGAAEALSTQHASEISAAQVDVLDHQAHLAGLRLQLAKAVDDSARRTAQTVELERELAIARREVVDHEAQLADLRTELAKAVDDSAQRTARNTELERELSGAQAEVADHRTLWADLRNQRGQSVDDTTERARQKIVLERELAAARREVFDCEAQLAELRAERAQSFDEVAERTARNAALERDLAAARQELADHEVQLTDLGTQRAQSIAESAERTARNAELEGELAAAWRQVAEHEERLTELRTQRTQSFDESAKRTVENGDLERALATARGEVAGHEEQLADLATQRAQSNDESAEKTVRNVELESELAGARRQVADHEAQLADLLTERAQALDESAARVAANAQLQGDLALALGEIVDHETQLADFRSERAQSVGESAEQTAKSADLERKLATAQRDVIDHEAKLTVYGAQLADLNIELAQAVGDSAERTAANEVIIHDLQNEVEMGHNAIERELADAAAVRIEQSAKDETHDHVASELAAARNTIERLQGEMEGSRIALLDKEAVRSANEEAKRRALTESRAQLVRQRRKHFAEKHRAIHEQLSGANDALSNRPPLVPAAPSKNWVKRLKRTRSQFNTILFAPEWLEQQSPGLGLVTLKDYLANPDLHRFDPHPLFAASTYSDRYPDVAGSGMSPLEHYVRHGWREGRDPHPYFTNDWYLHQNLDVLAHGEISPLEHYLSHGWLEGRRPNPVFDPKAYLKCYPDVAVAGLEPLTHYVVHGAGEGREIPLDGDELDWRSLTPAVGTRSVIDYLLTSPAPTVIAETALDSSVYLSRTLQHNELSTGSLEAWPPNPINGYWLPQRLRDFIVEAHGEHAVPRYRYLCSVMDAYGGDPEGFASSDACEKLMAQARSLSDRVKPSDDHPKASIIVPVYNNIVDTLLCIVSILDSNTVASYEIIVADDGSNDATASLIPRIGGIVRHLRQPKNLGFLRNCNAAASTVRGLHLVLLNNDTLVMPGWLDALLAPFERNERTGLVGSKLLSWDGSLQEAGGIFWQDGSAWNFGRGQDALAPEYNYLKDVDYCSGASIAVSLPLWQELGGFDTLFEPAYCEDADLAFRVRAAGYRTLYNPQSEVLHHEGRSHGRDVNTGIKAYQLANQGRFLERWKKLLAKEHFPNARNVLTARDRSSGKMHVLVIDHYVPQWDRDAGSRTILHFLETLIAEGCAVTFWPDNLHYDRVYAPRLQAIGVEVIHGAEYLGSFERFLLERTGLYDLVLLSRPNVADKYIEPLSRMSGAKLIYYGHDIHFRRMELQRAAGDESVDDLAIETMKAAETAICLACDVALYPDPDEAKLMQQIVGEDTRCMAVPAYCYDEVQFNAAAETVRLIAGSERSPMNLLFVGGFSHDPNRDGITWFCDAVIPELRANGVEFKLLIAGSNITADISALASNEVDVLGYVCDADLSRLYREASAVIAPLRFGAGVKGKVIQAMAHGVTVITTSVGAQGIDCAGECLFICSDAAGFAEAVKQAADPALAAQKASRALDYVRDYYSTNALRSAFRNLLTSSA